MELTLATEDAEQTRAVGEVISKLLESGDVVSLTGELGAGKTTFTQGVARGLDVEQQVVSPTFTLVREYKGRMPVFHVDVYRLSRIQDVIDLGFDEMTDSGGVTLVEWGDVVEGLFDDFLQIEFTLPDRDSDVRRIRITPAGLSWERRMPELSAMTGEWA